VTGGATHELFGRLKAEKGGRPANLVFFLCHFSHSRVVHFLVFPRLMRIQAEEELKAKLK